RPQTRFHTRPRQPLYPLAGLATSAGEAADPVGFAQSRAARGAHDGGVTSAGSTAAGDEVGTANRQTAPPGRATGYRVEISACRGCGAEAELRPAVGITVDATIGSAFPGIDFDAGVGSSAD